MLKGDFMIKNRNGNIIESNHKQNNILRFLYNNAFSRILLKLLTAPAVSKIIGIFMDSAFSIPIIKPFVKNNNINLSEYKPKKFTSYNDFFTRKIKPEKRPVDYRKSSLISPCDSKLTVYKINENSIFRIKDSYYKTSDLIQNKFIAERYRNGYCLIFRLCVDDYHRYCYIDNGIKTENVFINGELHTVNPIALDKYNIYKRNCREFTMLHTENFGDVIQTEVGAMLVGRIKNYHKHIYCFSKGEEKGLFEFGGSTIVLLFENGMIDIDRDILENSVQGIETAVKYGETIGKKRL